MTDKKKKAVSRTETDATFDVQTRATAPGEPIPEGFLHITIDIPFLEGDPGDPATRRDVAAFLMQTVAERLLELEQGYERFDINIMYFSKDALERMADAQIKREQIKREWEAQKRAIHERSGRDAK